MKNNMTVHKRMQITMNYFMISKLKKEIAESKLKKEKEKHEKFLQSCHN